MRQSEDNLGCHVTLAFHLVLIHCISQTWPMGFRHFFLHPHLTIRATQIEMVTATSCCVCVWGSKLGPHIRLTRTLATEPSRKPRVSSFHPINRYHNPVSIIRCFMKIRLVPDFQSSWKTVNHL